MCRLQHHKVECALNRAKCAKDCGFEGNGNELRNHDCVKYLKNIVNRLQQENISERFAKVTLQEDHNQCLKKVNLLLKEVQDLAEENRHLKEKFDKLAKIDYKKLSEEKEELKKENFNNETLVKETTEPTQNADICEVI